MLDFPKRVLFLGYGAVAQCALPIFVKHVRIPPANISVMDFEDRADALKPWTAQGVHWVRQRITPDNLAAGLEKHVSAGDLIIDLAWNIDCLEILQFCHDRGILYVNTSVEVWDPYNGGTHKHPTTRTLYWRHMNLRRMTAAWPAPGPTAVLEHGANPGLISHWTKQGLIDIGCRLLDDKKVAGQEADEIRQLIADRMFNRLAMKLGVKVIHCSERDTQIADRPKQVDEFVNTWSIEGFREEGTTTAEMGWGTHEKQLPRLAYEHADGPRNQICLARMGINTWVQSWVPNYRILGMVVRHGEAFTISDKLTVWQDGGDCPDFRVNENGTVPLGSARPIYRPTVHYAYCPCDCAIASLYEMRGYGYQLQPNLRIMTDEITQGEDILGALIMGHAYNSWWTGSILSIEESRRLVPHQNATTMQVAISAVAAAMWMMQNPGRGVCVPDDLPHDFVLDIANPYLGRSLSVPSDWTPLKYHAKAFEGFNQPDLDWSDPWQFKNFLIDEND
ncbi:MAG: saccharopine dehydrogenase C-terminal domain-containing protein [Thermoguttaceae bacterium]|jgi:homospermidine synthase